MPSNPRVHLLKHDEIFALSLRAARTERRFLWERRPSLLRHLLLFNFLLASKTFSHFFIKPSFSFSRLELSWDVDWNVVSETAAVCVSNRVSSVMNHHIHISTDCFGWNDEDRKYIKKIYQSLSVFSSPKNIS